MGLMDPLSLVLLGERKYSNNANTYLPLRGNCHTLSQKPFSVVSLFRSGFAGSQPVSMDVQNIGMLHEKPYRLSWKADGTRCINRGEVK